MLRAAWLSIQVQCGRRQIDGASNGLIADAVDSNGDDNIRSRSTGNREDGRACSQRQISGGQRASRRRPRRYARRVVTIARADVVSRSIQLDLDLAKVSRIARGQGSEPNKIVGAALAKSGCDIHDGIIRVRNGAASRALRKRLQGFIGGE